AGHGEPFRCPDTKGNSLSKSLIHNLATRALRLAAGRALSAAGGRDNVAALRWNGPAPRDDEAQLGWLPFKDQSHPHERRQTSCFGFLHDAGAMYFDGPLANAQLRRDRLVGLSLDQLLEHSFFPRSQGRKIMANRLRRGAALAQFFGGAGKRLLNRVEQC